MKTRIVVTGYGVINALGQNNKAVEQALFAGKSGLSETSFFSKSGEIKGVVGRVQELTAVDSFFEETHIPYDRCAQLALMAAQECVLMSHVDDSSSAFRKGVAIGTSLGGMLSGQRFHREWRENGIDSADANLLYAYPLHAISDIVARKFHFRGVKAIISTACAASSNIVGYACDMIRSGKQDYMLAGGVDPLSSFSFAGFNALKALDPNPCMPYSGSHGINLGEGGAFLMLEEYNHAVNRGATIYAEILSCGLSADAYHPTAPDLGGGGASRAMKAAVELSGIPTEMFTYVNGHGTGTSANDTAERLAVKSLFGARVSEVPLSSIKGAIGHCLGAAGIEECVACIMALNRNEIPPTVNFDENYNSAPFDFVPNIARKASLKAVLSNSFAFGGNNSCLAISKAGIDRELQELSNEEIVITGAGCCGVGGTSLKELWATISNQKCCIGSFHSDECECHQAGEMPAVEWKKYIPGKILRRIDEITKLTMASGKQAMDHANVHATQSTMNRIGVIYATGTGPLGTIVNIDRTIIEKGMAEISLSEFPNSVINAAPGNFCIANMLKGPTSTLSCGISSFLMALNYATILLRQDTADTIVVISADECDESLLIGNDKVSLLSHGSFSPMTSHADGMVLSPGSVALVIEKRSHAIERGATPIAKISGFGFSSDNCAMATVSPDGEALAESIRQSIKESGITSPDLYLCTAMGIPACDDADIHAINIAYKEGLISATTKCSAISPLLGIASGSSSGYSLLSALYAFENDVVPAMPVMDRPTPAHFVQGKNESVNVKKACISTMSLGGAYAAVVIEKEI